MKHYKSVVAATLIVCSLGSGCINSNNTGVTIERKKIDATVSCLRSEDDSGDEDGRPLENGKTDFMPTKANLAISVAVAPAGMKWVPGGEFSMGAMDPSRIKNGGHEPMADARPVHRVYVDGFYMDATEVTNAEFAAFVNATGYKTVAEQIPTRAEFPDAPEQNLVAGSVVFSPPAGPVSLNDYYQWWSYVPAADWRHPTGAGSTIAGRENYPVVQIAWEDAAAYAKWAGKRLPTEAEWEFAARGGKAGQLYGWGNELHPDGHFMANTFQGHFPDADAGEDGSRGIAPVAQFSPNEYGLYDMEGNVWEWCNDWYRADYYRQLAGAAVSRNPTGPVSAGGVKEKVQRGGSFLCTDQYCARYLVGSRGKGDWRSGANHIGFRCVSGGRMKSSSRLLTRFARANGDRNIQKPY
ncbi:MAG TPA: formylglycine-generating enzyme family protein [Puia sp.]|jgi:formylglycine-generating enzyme required for sulfatase activity